MTAQILPTVISEEFIVVLQSLSSEQRQQVFDFAEFLAGRRELSASTDELKSAEDEKKSVLSMPPRIFGLHAGQAVMGADFDDPMPDEFWFGHPDPLMMPGEKVSEISQALVSE
jgi:hypothetical protein